MAKVNVEEVVIDGKTYVPKGSEVAQKVDGMRFIMCRTYSAGVFAGYLKQRTGQEVTLVNAIRIWCWDGAASLSQLAMEGTNKPNGCKFAMPVNEVELLNAIEIIPITAIAEASIKGVTPWKK